MTLSELTVVLFGLFGGYWVMSKLILKPPKVPPQSAPHVLPGGTSIAWHEILNLPPTASVEQIRDAYVQLAEKYSGPQLEHLTDELRRLAAQKLSELTAARDAGLRTHGEPP
jgi:DnaJ-domain-containing protein 1